MNVSNAGNTRIFQFFKAGNHTSMNGQTSEWTEADLQNVVANYKTRTSGETAPLVLGHPATDDPAYGQVVDIFQKQGVLYAVAEVSERLISLVRDKYFNNVSASFKPSVGRAGWCLRHIGFLGAIPPAVKGLEPLKFGEFQQLPGQLCFATPSGTVSPPKRLAVPAGWNVTTENWALYEYASEIHADCPSLQFSEAAILAEKYFTQSR